MASSSVSRRTHDATSVPTPATLDERAATFGALRRLDPVLQIRSRMRELGLSSADLAARLGVSEANVSRLLKGDQNLKIDTLYRLADAVDAPLTVMLGTPAPGLAPSSVPQESVPVPFSAIARALPRDPSLPSDKPIDRRQQRRASETLVPAGSDTKGRRGLRPMSRAAMLAQVRTNAPTPVVPSVPDLIRAHDLAALRGWIAHQAPNKHAPEPSWLFKACLNDGWAEGAQALWDGHRLDLMDALMLAWSVPEVRTQPVTPYPENGRRLLDALTWDPAAAAPLNAKAQALTWARALGRLWAEGRYDRWHEALARSKNPPGKALEVMRNNVWHDVYTDLHAPEDERARAVRALIAMNLPMSPAVVSMAYADQDPLLKVLLEHPDPALGPLRATLLLCQAGLINRWTTVPRAQREAFEAGMLRWGAQPMVLVTQKDFDQLGPDRFFSAGYLRVDGPRGARTTTWQDGDVPPILQGQRATMTSPATRAPEDRVYVGMHWRLDDGWDKAKRQTYVLEFEQRLLRAVASDPEASSALEPSGPRRRL